MIYIPELSHFEYQWQWQFHHEKKHNLALLLFLMVRQTYKREMIKNEVSIVNNAISSTKHLASPQTGTC